MRAFAPGTDASWERLTQMTADAKDLGAYDVIAKAFDAVTIPQVLVHSCQSKAR